MMGEGAKSSVSGEEDHDGGRLKRKRMSEGDRFGILQ